MPLAWYNTSIEKDVGMLQYIFPHQTPHKKTTLTFTARNKMNTYRIIADDGNNNIGKHKPG